MEGSVATQIPRKEADSQRGYLWVVLEGPVVTAGELDVAGVRVVEERREST